MRVASSPSRCTSTCVCVSFACELGLPPFRLASSLLHLYCEHPRSYTLSQTHCSAEHSPPMPPPSATIAARSRARPLCLVLDRCVESGLGSLRPSDTPRHRPCCVLLPSIRVAPVSAACRLLPSAARSRCEAASRVAQTNHALTSLDVGYNDIRDEGASALARALEVRYFLS